MSEDNRIIDGYMSTSNDAGDDAFTLGDMLRTKNS